MRFLSIYHIEHFYEGSHGNQRYLPFASDGLTVSATTIKEENIAYNQSLAVQSNAVANWPTGPVISAESAILMDADTGAILYAKIFIKRNIPPVPRKY